MLTHRQLNRIIHQKENVVYQLINLIRSFNIYLVSEKLYFQDSDYLNIHYSTSIVKKPEHSSYENKTIDLIYRKLEQEQCVERIVEAINKIMIKEDRLIFIDRYFYRKSIKYILDKFYISTSSYYAAIKRAESDFLKALTD